MPRIFAYARVSTTGQTTENQLHEIEAAGFAIAPRRVVSETISGSTAAAQRRGFIAHVAFDDYERLGLRDFTPFEAQYTPHQIAVYA